MRSLALATLVALAATALSCGGDDAEEGLPGSTPCEKWAALAQRTGCNAPTECIVAPACSDAAMGWMDCIARDLAQCLCEGDGELNCEGSHKPDEGPALCVNEFSSFDACEDRNQ